jgi:nuclear protein localization family protein 4
MYKNEYGLEVKKSAKPCFPVEYLMVNVTNGFPQSPSPLFQSSTFSIENRPGLEDQRTEDILSALLRLDAPNIHGTGSDAGKRIELAKWLSDWHLIAYLGTTQLISPDDVKLFMRVASSPTLLEDSSQLDPIFQTEGWQTLTTFAREYAPVRPSASALSSSTHMNEDIPQDVLDQIAAAEAVVGGGGAGSGSARGPRICPHCTFENDHGGTDCEVCGLPLD